MMLQRASIAYMATVARLSLAWSVRYPARLRQPCLVLQGDGDALLSLEGAKALVDLMPCAELQVVECAWHNLLWDPPTTKGSISTIVNWLNASTTPRPRLCAYRRSPLHAWLRSHGLGFWSTFLIASLTLSLVTGAVAAASGVLFAPSPASAVGPVAAAWQFLEPLLTLGLGKVSLLSRAYSAAGSSQVTPYSRDYLYLAGLLLLGWYVAIQHQHWIAISEVPRQLESSGLINSRVITPRRVDQVVTCADKRCNSGIASATIMSAAAATGVTWLVERHGIYGFMAPPESNLARLWQANVLSGWWGNPHIGSVLTLACFALLVFAFVYAMIRGNQIGIAAVEMLDHLLGSSGGAWRQEAALRLAPEHPDGFAGLGLVRRVLGFAMLSTGVLFGALVTLALYMPRAASVWCLPFLLVAGTVSPYLVSRPIYALNREMARQRAAFIVAANAGIETARKATRLRSGVLEYWIWRREVAERSPSEVYSTGRFVIYTALYVVPLISLLVSTLR